MKRTSILILFIVLVSSVLSAGEKFSDSQAEDILYLLEEEKLARDVYTVLGEHWNVRVFSNIALSEEQHRSQVETLADNHGIEYEILPQGEFTNTELQSLYDRLVAQGLSSLTEAFKVGKSIEILDIRDIDNMLNQEPPDVMTVVLEALQRGSENHLAAFERQLSR